MPHYWFEVRWLNRFHCFTKDTEGKACRKLAICLWDGGQRGDDGFITGVGANHLRSGREWIGGADLGTDGTDSIDIMWRFFQWSVGN